MAVGMIPALVGRVSFTGDLGYEIWVTADYQRALYDLLRAPGDRFGLRALWRSRAQCACAWKRSSAPGRANTARSTGPYEAGLGRFVDLTKGEFIGRAAGGRRASSRAASAGSCASRCRRRCRCDRR